MNSAARPRSRALLDEPGRYVATEPRPFAVDRARCLRGLRMEVCAVNSGAEA